jgi:hypothetical protein
VWVEARALAVLSAVTSLYGGPSAGHEMHNEKNEADDEQNVEQAGGYVKCEKPKQPTNDQDCCDKS